jgi:hypothetical protein
MSSQALPAAIARAVGESRLVVCVLAIGAMIPAVVMARVVVDTAVARNRRAPV